MNAEVVLHRTADTVTLRSCSLLSFYALEPELSVQVDVVADFASAACRSFKQHIWRAEQKHQSQCNSAQGADCAGQQPSLDDVYRKNGLAAAGAQTGMSNGAAAAASQKVVSHDFEFPNLEFARPSRMNKVYMVFSCQACFQLPRTAPLYKVCRGS